MHHYHPPAHYQDALAIIAEMAPDDPYFCIRPAVLAKTARHFIDHFDGDVLYAVKCNHDPNVIRALWQGGIRHFDTASMAEIALVKTMYPEAHCYLMHPVKARAVIREAYLTWGVRSFVIDHPDELAKMRDELGDLGETRMMVRLATRKGAAIYDLGGKFGCTPGEAAALAKAAHDYGARIGYTFHVGSQCLDPKAWVDALDLVSEAIRISGIKPEVIDLGGGYPTPYVDLPAPDFAVISDAVRHKLNQMDLADGCRLWCEPGRALVAPGASVLTRIQLRRDRQFYLNDGFHGSLSFVNHEKLLPPLRLIPQDGRSVSTNMLSDITFFGPTCDSIDVFSGASFRLPDDAREGDWIEFGNAGAYSIALANAFNGFDCHHIVTVDDDGAWECAQMPATSLPRAAE